MILPCASPCSACMASVTSGKTPILFSSSRRSATQYSKVTPTTTPRSRHLRHTPYVYPRHTPFSVAITSGRVVPSRSAPHTEAPPPPSALSAAAAAAAMRCASGRPWLTT